MDAFWSITSRHAAAHPRPPSCMSAAECGRRSCGSWYRCSISNISGIASSRNALVCAVSHWPETWAQVVFATAHRPFSQDPHECMLPLTFVRDYLPEPRRGAQNILLVARPAISSKGFFRLVIYFKSRQLVTTSGLDAAPSNPPISVHMKILPEGDEQDPRRLRAAGCTHRDCAASSFR